MITVAAERLQRRRRDLPAPKVIIGPPDKSGDDDQIEGN